ncbi:MAG TPA: Fic family protein [Acidobacteriaceae bacterium]|nr:Fic family protein [Acidobacteriaceae bacterium]
MADDTRHSKAQEVEIARDPDDLARLESYNTIKQYRKIEEMVGYFIEPEHPFKLRPSHILTLHRAALEGISATAGVWRPAGVSIGGSKHTPPDAFQVPERIEDLCDYINEKWDEKSPLHLAAYVMWRLNWIHPFTDGNGRTSRAVSYLVLCIRLNMLPPGRMTIPQQIEQEKTPYYKALEAADEACDHLKIDLTAMKELLGAMLAKQLHAIYEHSEAGAD